MNQQENDDTISTASSDLNFSVCELILGPGACQSKKKPQRTLSEKTIFYSFSSPEKAIAVRESGSLVKVQFENPAEENLSKKSLKDNEITESEDSVTSTDFVKVSHEQPDSLKAQKSSKDVAEKSEKKFHEEDSLKKPKSTKSVSEKPERKSKTETPSFQKEEVITPASKKQSKMSNSGDQTPRSLHTREKPRETPETAEKPPKKFAETQTVEVQTQTKSTDSETECKCETFLQKCPCPECNPPQCLHNFSPPKEETPTRDYDETSSSSVYNAPSTPSSPNYCNCRANPHWKCDCEDFSDNSDDSYTTDFLNLPYQNNEEYLQLLRELERKLLARNRERVRRTRLEFEQRSRQNQNLEKPVFDYSYSGDESCSFFKRKLQKPSSPRQHSCSKCKKRVNSDILQNEKKWEKFNFVDSFSHQVASKEKNEKFSHVERSLNKSHWQLDPRSGEWIKVASFEQTQFANPLDSGDFECGSQRRARSGKRGECPCCCKKKYKNY